MSTDHASSSSPPSPHRPKPKARRPTDPSDPLALDLPPPKPLEALHNILLPYNPNLQTLLFHPSGEIGSIIPTTTSPPSRTPPSALALPSLCSPHIHLDKPHLLTHPQTSHLSPRTGSFPEALSLTASAKAHYTRASLLERGNQLIADSARAGVTHMRAFVEVDGAVGLLCVEVGLALKQAWKEHVYVQLCAFAQEPLFSALEPDAGGEEEGEREREGAFLEQGNANLPLLLQALDRDGVEVLGTTPYVEGSAERRRANIAFAVREAAERRVCLDLHLDYNLDPGLEPDVWFVLERLRAEGWGARQAARARGGGKRTVCLGHCTRLTLFSPAEWRRLRDEIVEGELPVYFIALPTSDLFMQGRQSSPPSGDSEDRLDRAAHAVALAANRPRCTLPLPALRELGLKVAMGVNNVGNAFTPFGSADPLGVASWGVGVWQVGTKEGVRGLYEAVSGIAKEAIGIGEEEEKEYMWMRGKKKDGNVRVWDEGDLVLFGEIGSEMVEWPEGYGKSMDIGGGKRKKFQRLRRSVEEVVWDPEVERTVISRGRLVIIDLIAPPRFI